MQTPSLYPTRAVASAPSYFGILNSPPNSPSPGDYYIDATTYNQCLFTGKHWILFSARHPINSVSISKEEPSTQSKYLSLQDLLLDSMDDLLGYKLSKPYFESPGQLHVSYDPALTQILCSRLGDYRIIYISLESTKEFLDVKETLEYLIEKGLLSDFCKIRFNDIRGEVIINIDVNALSLHTKTRKLSVFEVLEIC